MVDSANPGHYTLDAHAEAAVRHAAETAKIEIPLEGFLRELVFLDTRDEQIVIVDTLTAADDFPVTFRRQDVHAQRDLGPIGIRLHVEGLHGRRVAMYAHRAIEVLGDRGFVRRATVASPFEGQALLFEQLCRTLARTSWQGTLYGL